MSQCTWIEGGYTFNVLFGVATASVCFAVAIPMLWWALAKPRVCYFGSIADPHQLLQLAYGIFCLSMACADLWWGIIPHAMLLWIHPALVLTTALIGIGLGPRAALLIGRQCRRTTRLRSGLSAGERTPVPSPHQ